MKADSGRLSVLKEKLAHVYAIRIVGRRLVRPRLARIVVSFSHVVEVFTRYMMVKPVVLVGISPYCAVVFFLFFYRLLRLVHLNGSDQSVAIGDLDSKGCVFNLFFVASCPAEVHQIKIQFVLRIEWVCLFNGSLSLDDYLVIHDDLALVLP